MQEGSAESGGVLTRTLDHRHSSSNRDFLRELLELARDQVLAHECARQTYWSLAAPDRYVRARGATPATSSVAPVRPNHLARWDDVVLGGTGRGDLVTQGSIKYVPILKAREAEIKALMRAPTSVELTPFFELQAAPVGGNDPLTGNPRRAKRATTDASYFLDDIARLWPEPFFVDISRVAQPGTHHRWWSLLAAVNSLAPAPAELVPVLLPQSDEDERRAAGEAAAVTGRAALRVKMLTARANPAALVGVTGSIASDAGVPVSKLDVVLDWADTTEMFSLDTLVTDTVAVIEALDGQHARLITSGTPNSSTFQQAGDWHATRREWWLWLRLMHSGHNVDYGDYALYPPSDPVPVTPQYGHLRYSSDDTLHVHRRAKPRTGGGLGGAFEECCKHLIGQPYWLGETFSGADRRFHDIAGAADKESSPGKWRQLAAEHHFEVVARQLGSCPAPPPQGTP